ncbi:M1 family metallopeptidase [Maribacter sp. PR1]|uniref:M1 family metallopeptidase n=1 Tax=Maribacter cobaltidurans TaxID=1178778 RepID=A0ABU7IVB6_9FLAO|nr:MULTISPECIES: M1 family metallopeptidase [Maribacter]MDC6389455.1 M1 family metallopeptidase [Maribacter sp. PR1]MEE1976844.1 M1 family metallopeptidase [Maribacter cobaltidurans]
MNKFLVLFASLLFFQFSNAQEFTQQDTLRGSITPERAWWDLNYYHLDIEVQPDDKFISGTNTIRYKVLDANQVLQVDLQPPLSIEKVTQDGKKLEFETNGNAHFVKLEKTQKEGDYNEIVVHYSGHPKEAVRAPWDGGFSWKKDENGNHFVGTSCQGLGASVWWPNKDHMYDEVDSMLMSVKVPKGLTGVSNGRLRKVDKDTNTYHWFVSNPINNYGVNVNIGDYVHFGEDYEGEKGMLDMDYYVLRDNLEKAKEQFKQAPKMMEAFEHWFGPYPFYEDSFKLVEVPYLGMEHQSSVTYGNQYGNGYLGRDLSGTGWGLKFDYIIIHEAGHEWFANNITYKDIADMWVHEGFTMYSESLFIEYYYGKEAAAEYLLGIRKNIRNDRPLIGPYDVNKSGSGDMYNKGANILHTFRQIMDDDEQWRATLRGVNEEFYHETVTSKQIENYLDNQVKGDFGTFFDQYLRTADIPIFEYEIQDGIFKYRYQKVVDDFKMPLRILLDKEPKWITPSSNWHQLAIKKGTSVQVDPNFYVEVKSK